jgi:hypothetical protein
MRVSPVLSNQILPGSNLFLPDFIPGFISKSAASKGVYEKSKMNYTGMTTDLSERKEQGFMALPADGDYNKVPYETGVQVMFYDNREDEDYPLHWHTATEIIMPIKHGYQVVLLKKPYTLRENDILVIPSCELHSISVPPSARNGKRIILMFEPTLLYSLSGLSGTLSVLHNLNLLTPETTPEIYETARSILSAIYDEYLRADALRNPAIYAKIIEFYIVMARYYAGKNLSTPPPPPHCQ